MDRSGLAGYSSRRHALGLADPDTNPTDSPSRANCGFPARPSPSGSTKTNGYEFDARSGTLAVQRGNGSSVLLPTSGKGIKPGVWVLAVRLQLHYLQAALIPVLKIVISESGNVSYAVYEGERNASVNPCPEQMKYHDPCRKLAQDTKAAVSQ